MERPPASPASPSGKGEARERLRAIVERGVQAVQPSGCLEPWLGLEGERVLVGGRDASPEPGGRLVVLAAGKAAAGMVEATLSLLGERVDELVAVAPAAPPAGLALPERSRWVVGRHPVPDAGSLEGARALDDAARHTGPTDRVLVLLSGGASALVSEPATGIAPDEKALVHRALIESGAPIADINAVRKHLSAVKGGWLGAATGAGAVHVLMISDVVGDAPDAIASGPFAPDPTTYADARSILRERGLWERVPASVRTHLERGCAGEIPETPGPGDPRLAGITHHLIASNATALAASRREAERLGYRCRLVEDAAEGPSPEVARRLARAIGELGAADVPACVLSGGESTVVVRGSGLGGRCQELSLELAVALQGRAGVTWLVAGTDGRDGPGHAAGAFGDGGTVARARRAGLEASEILASNDTTRLFEALGDLYVTGPTGTNVMDLRVALVDAAA